MEEKIYTIGKGKLLFKASGQTNFQDLGNAPDFKIATNIEKLAHFSQRAGMKTKDAEKTIEQTGTGSFTLDDLISENLRMYLMSAAANSVVQAADSVADQAVTTEHDKWIDLGKKKLSSVVVKAGDPDAWEATTEYEAGDFVSKVVANAFRYECTTPGTSGAQEPAWPTTVGETVEDGTAVWTCRKLTFAVTTDYRLDAASGLLMPLATGGIPSGEVLEVSYDHAALTQKRYDAASATTIEGDLFFVGDPPAGKILDVKGYVSLKPTGDLSLVGDDWTNLVFEAEFLSGNGYNGLFDVYDRGTV